MTPVGKIVTYYIIHITIFSITNLIEDAYSFKIHVKYSNTNIIQKIKKKNETDL